MCSSDLGPERLDRHRDERVGDAFTGGQQHVEFAGRRSRTHLFGEVEQLVGGIAHRGDDDDDVVAADAPFPFPSVSESDEDESMKQKPFSAEERSGERWSERSGERSGLRADRDV